MFLRTPLLAAGFAAAVFVCLIWHRGWWAAHFSRRARAAYFAICLAVAGGAAGAFGFRFDDEIMCPAGSEGPDLRPARSSGGKGAVKVVCRDEAGRETAGSMFAGLFAVLGVGVLAFAGASGVWRMLGPPAPPAPPLPPASSYASGTPTDRRERRRERKRAAHRQRED
jgi:hypothetical protein